MNTVVVLWNKDLWQARLGTSPETTAAIDDFETDLIAINSLTIATVQEVLISLSDAPDDDIEDLEIKIIPPTVEGWDFNEVLRSDWGKIFLNVFSQYGINFHNN